MKFYANAHAHSKHCLKKLSESKTAENELTSAIKGVSVLLTTSCTSRKLKTR